MEETQEILRQMGFENPNDNVWKSQWFGYFILAKEATPQQLALFIFDRGYNKGLKDIPSGQIKPTIEGEKCHRLQDNTDGMCPDCLKDHYEGRNV